MQDMTVTWQLKKGRYWSTYHYTNNQKTTFCGITIPKNPYKIYIDLASDDICKVCNQIHQTTNWTVVKG